MSKRPVDPSFGLDEELWRRIEKGDVKKDDGTLKPQKLRLQISTVRQRHGDKATVTSGKWNGIATTTAGAVVQLAEHPLSVVCVDEPTDDPGHALIALVATPGHDVTDGHIEALRARVAQALTITQSPT